MADADALLALEDEVLKIAAGGYLDAVARIRDLLASEPGKVRAAVLRLVAPAIGRDAVAAVGRAWSLGLTETHDDVDKAKKEDAKVARALARSVPKAVVRDMSGLRSMARSSLAEARRLILAGVDPAAAVAPLLGSASKIERTIRTTVNDARNTAAVTVATAAGQEMTVEAERDACAECLAYAGQVSKTGTFDGSLTFGRPKKNAPRVKSCPIHPNCRCRIVVLNDRGYAEALRREAKRSILRGYALPSESKGVRIEAAKRLLATDNGMPKSVQALARRAVKAGEFPDQARPESARR